MPHNPLITMSAPAAAFPAPPAGRPAEFANDGTPGKPSNMPLPARGEEGATPRVLAEESLLHAVPFLDRGRRQCAWPLWDDATPRADRKVCGAPTLPGRGSWCAQHARRAWITETVEAQRDTNGHRR